jgi:hypothetical protein
MSFDKRDVSASGAARLLDRSRTMGDPHQDTGIGLAELEKHFDESGRPTGVIREALGRVNHAE